jgi:hypothetical protein
MSDCASVGRSPSTDDADTPATPMIGVEPQYSDCVIKCESGSLYYTTKATMVGCSPVFRDMVECCGPEASSYEVHECHEPTVQLQTRSRSEMIEIPMPDPEEEIMTLIELFHQPDRFLGSVVPAMTKEGTAKILQLIPIAHKYDIQGKSISRMTLVGVGCARQSRLTRRSTVVPGSYTSIC